ncbi:hypothetical protein BDR04DRAFT_1153661 [Suillus decipiens]|nr:hypothetical protein BDR04DRAFT_1153661 [Suillus decipiens]
MLMLREPCITVAQPKGISNLNKCEHVILADALQLGRLTIERQKNGDLNKTSPIIFSKAPPEDFSHSHGRRMLVDGTIDHQGIAHHGPSAARTKVKKLKPSTCKEGYHASPILRDNMSPQSQTIPKQKFVPIVEIQSRPPPHCKDYNIARLIVHYPLD